LLAQHIAAKTDGMIVVLCVFSLQMYVTKVNKAMIILIAIDATVRGTILVLLLEFHFSWAEMTTN